MKVVLVYVLEYVCMKDTETRSSSTSASPPVTERKGGEERSRAAGRNRE